MQRIEHYIAASLIWLWVAEGQRPSPADLVGAAIAIAGALVIIGFAARTRWRDSDALCDRCGTSQMKKSLEA